MKIPEGWKLVPVEPTEEMIEKGAAGVFSIFSKETWERMLEAAPTPPEWWQQYINDVNRLVREMDVTLNGEEGAAQQASLCDMVAQISAMKRANMILSAPPAQKPEPVYLTRGPGHASYLHVDSYSVGYYRKMGWAVWVAFPVDLEIAKAAETAAQEDEPQLTSRVPYREAYQRGYEAAMNKKEKEDKPVAEVVAFGCGVAVTFVGGIGNYPVGTKLYTRPQSDELKKAAEELDKFIHDGMRFNKSAYEKEMTRLVGNLHSALEEKSDA